MIIPFTTSVRQIHLEAGDIISITDSDKGLLEVPAVITGASIKGRGGTHLRFTATASGTRTHYWEDPLDATNFIDIYRGRGTVEFFIANIRIALLHATGVWEFAGGLTQTAYDATTIVADRIAFDSGTNRLRFAKHVASGQYGVVMEIGSDGFLLVNGTEQTDGYPNTDHSFATEIEAPSGDNVYFSYDKINTLAKIEFQTDIWRLACRQLLFGVEL